MSLIVGHQALIAFYSGGNPIDRQSNSERFKAPFGARGCETIVLLFGEQRPPEMSCGKAFPF